MKAGEASPGITNFWEYLLFHRSKIIFYIFLFFVLLGLLRSCVTIGPGDRGIVIRMGKVQDRVLTEGMHFIVPYTDSVQKMSVRIQKSEINTDAASKDLQTVRTTVVINWHIDPLAVNTVYQSLGEMEEVISRILGPAVSEVLKAATAKHSATDILIKRGELKDEIDKNLVTRVQRYHIEIDGVSLTDFTFSPEFAKAIEEKQVAEQEAQKAVYIAQQAEQQAKAKINQARGESESQRLLASTIRGQVITLKAIEKWDGHFPQVMGTGALPFINLKNLQSDDDKK